MRDIFTPADILLPREGTDMTRWASLACDQFSARPDYWRAMDGFVAGAPSTLRLMLPEAFLNEPDAAAREAAMLRAMEEYLVGDIFREIRDSYIYVERTLQNGKVRRGIVGKLDLEAYDWTAGSASPVRATEATVAERLPARVRLRRQAALEMPHIVLFMDGAGGLMDAAASGGGETLYDFDLYGGAGRIRGVRLWGAAARAVKERFDALPGPVVFAMGDGNHSLAAAKEHWEALKAAGAPADHPARYALAEAEDLRDPAVEFFPIHRVVLGADAGGAVETLSGGDTGALVARADQLARAWTAEHGGTVDYIHGEAEARALAGEPGGRAWLLPALDKGELVPHILRQGNYPKKSFSVGHALDKRWYLECRRIR